MTGSNSRGGPASEIDGDANFTGKVKSEGVSLPDHTHMEQGDGKPVSKPIK